ncbi:MAG: Vms1/Ankzf1 family peptidyl-tRNA hydrolase [Candidatus Nanohalobium sp.]
MKLPWNTEEKDKEIQRLREKIGELEEEKMKLENQYQAEKERRSKLSSEKQEAQEKLNRLEDKLEGLKGEKKTEEEQEEQELQKIGFRKAFNLLKKLSTVSDKEEELVTVYCPRKFESFDRRKDLKNSVNREDFQQLSSRKSFAAFMDEDLGNWMLETRPFFTEKLEISGNFEASELLDFIEREKFWVLVSAGDTQIFTESSGEVKEVEHLKSRVEKKHSKGGFSQGRFERKREEQIQQHLDQVKEVVEGLSGEAFLLGDPRFCEEVPGRRLGGFDRNMSRPEQFYGFRLKRF